MDNYPLGSRERPAAQKKCAAQSSNTHITLLEAAQAICPYCKGSKGHEEIPQRTQYGWHHLFTIGNGSNPCAAPSLWDFIDNLLQEKSQ